MKLLIINPGNISTKLALYEDENQIHYFNYEHSLDEFKDLSMKEQAHQRLAYVDKFFKDYAIDEKEIECIVCRGGLLYGLKPGAYLVDEALCQASVDEEKAQMHASNLAALMGKELSDKYQIKAFIYDAVSSGNLSEVAKVTGFKEIQRHSFSHILNCRAMAYKYAEEINKNYNDLNLIMMHMGSGVSASVHRKGEVIDTMGDDDGHFSPERSGSAPSLELIKLFKKYDYKTMQKMIRGNGGIKAHLGISDLREVEKRLDEKEVELVFKAQAYQIAKSIGLLSITLKGDIDAIILTGGLAYSEKLCQEISSYVSFLAPVVVMPGEKEMEALARGGLRVMKKEEKYNLYGENND